MFPGVSCGYAEAERNDRIHISSCQIEEPAGRLEIDDNQISADRRYLRMFPFSNAKAANDLRTTDNPAGYDLMRGVSFQTRLFIFVLAFVFDGARCTAQSNRGQWVHTAWTDHQGAPSGITGISQGSDGFLYLVSPVGLTHFDGVSFEQVSIPEAEYGSDSGAFVLLRRRNGELWVTAPAGMVQQYRAQDVPFSRQLGIGPINYVDDHPDHVWFGGAYGLAYHGDQGVIRIATEDAAMLNGITGVQEARDGSPWISTLHGLVHLQSDELVHAIQRQYRLAYEVLGVEEGTPGSSLSSEQLTSQGILWLIGSSGIGYMNVDQPFAPTRPPTVRVRELEVNGALISVAEKLALGPHISNLEIRYAGANLANPENLIYRYRLSGVDKDWQNVGNAREAMYTNLAPGRYVFHVMAKNSGGPWSPDREFISVYLIPAWYQRTISKIFAAAASLCALLALFRWRLKLAERSILRSCDARLAERLRISADLHDTLLQTVQGSKLIAEDALAQKPDASLRPSMERILFRLAQAVEEGRETLKALRSTSGVRDELVKTLSKVATEICGLRQMAVSTDVSGIARDLHPVVHDEIGLICREAIRNACAHSNGARLSITVLYERDFSLTVSDDGQGISNSILENGRTGHFGLPSMRERAERIGGRLKIISQSGLGTSVIVEVPGSVAYVNVRKTSSRQEPGQSVNS
jgi:signal transduction histidine kinase